MEFWMHDVNNAKIETRHVNQEKRRAIMKGGGLGSERQK